MKHRFQTFAFALLSMMAPGSARAEVIIHNTSSQVWYVIPQSSPVAATAWVGASLNSLGTCHTILLGMGMPVLTVRPGMLWVLEVPETAGTQALLFLYDHNLANPQGVFLACGPSALRPGVRTASPEAGPGPAPWPGFCPDARTFRIEALGYPQPPPPPRSIPSVQKPGLSLKTLHSFRAMLSADEDEVRSLTELPAPLRYEGGRRMPDPEAAAAAGAPGSGRQRVLKRNQNDMADAGEAEAGMTIKRARASLAKAGESRLSLTLENRTGQPVVLILHPQTSSLYVQIRSWLGEDLRTLALAPGHRDRDRLEIPPGASAQLAASESTPHETFWFALGYQAASSERVWHAFQWHAGGAGTPLLMLVSPAGRLLVHTPLPPELQWDGDSFLRMVELAP